MDDHRTGMRGYCPYSEPACAVLAGGCSCDPGKRRALPDALVYQHSGGKHHVEDLGPASAGNHHAVAGNDRDEESPLSPVHSGAQRISGNNQPTLPPHSAPQHIGDICHFDLQ